jgi:hypothetical protein
MKRIINAGKVAIVLFLFVFGCTLSEHNPTGTWENVQTPETVEFKSDQTGIFVVKDKPSLPFKWALVENGKVKMDINIHGMIKTLYGKVDNGSFVMESDGVKATYRKVARK